MELLQLRYFQTVADMESITKAAAYYQIPQPSMSLMIRKLEHELGDINLFDRRNGRLYLNEQGEEFKKYVSIALQNIDEGVSVVSDNPDKISGSLRIKIFENHRFILTSIPKYLDIYPGVSFSASHGYYNESESNFDLCISSHTSYYDLLHAEPLIKEEVVLAVHEEHPLAKKGTVEICDLINEHLISMPPQSELYNITVERCHASGFEPQIPIICDDPYYIRKYVSDNMGIALAPSISWKGRFRSNTVLLPFKNNPIYVTSYLLWNDRRYLTSVVRSFRDFLLEEASNIPNNLI